MTTRVETTFGEIGKREIFVLRIYIENIAQTLNDFAKKAKDLFEKWPNAEPEDLEDLLWSICILFQGDCAICPIFFCEKNQRKAMKYDEQENH